MTSSNNSLNIQSLTESVRSVSLEHCSVSFVTGSSNSSENRKLDIVLPVLVASGPSDLFLFVKNGSSDDGNCVGRGSMISSHFRVELTDGTIEGDISIFFIHVMISCP